MDYMWLIGGIVVGSIVASLIYYFQQKSVLRLNNHSAESLVEQAKLRARLIMQKAESTCTAQKALLESRDESNKTLFEAEENRLLQQTNQLEHLMTTLESQKALFASDNEQLIAKKKTYAEMEKKHRDALENIAKTTASSLWQHHLSLLCKDEQQAQQQHLEKIYQNTHDRVEAQAMSIMNVINQRYDGESTRDPTLIEIEFSPKEFERIVGDTAMSKIIHLQTSLGSELKLECTDKNCIRVFGYDLWRRYIVKGALERMKKNSKLPLELALTETQKFTEQRMLRIGKKACDYLGIHDFPTELIKLVGRLDYRTSFGQNIYRHSIEVAVLGKMIAQEIGCDPYICIVGGLLHDIGKGVDADVAGGHDAIGRDIALNYHLHPDIVHSIYAHHEMEPYRSVEARVVQLADAISAARPGARHHEPLEEYIARMKALEEAAVNQAGIEKAFVMQAGREIRAFVNADKTTDDQARQIALKIVEAVQASNAVRSGEVKIQVIRELDVNAYAGKRKGGYTAKR